jgi:hypothetical protein
VTLAQAYYALAAFLCLGGWLLCSGSSLLVSFRRDRLATLVLLGLAVGWFAWQLYTMPDPDLAGLPRNLVLIVFVGASLLTYIYMPDFLSVRCFAVLMLFLARLTLDAGYRQLPYSLLAASVSYGLLVLFGLWWASAPAAFNQHCDWVLASPTRRQLIGGLWLGLGLACLYNSTRLA